MRTDTSDEPGPTPDTDGTDAASRPAVAADRSAALGAHPDGPGLPLGLIAVVAVVGMALRVAILLSPLGRPDSDEVIAALMARHVGDDGFPTFFWGQQYGGTIELVPVLVSLKLFGWSVAAMRVPTIVLAIVNPILVWRIGRHWLTERQAQLAGLLLWLGPPAALWFGVREQLFYAPNLTMGLVVGLAAYRVRAKGSPWAYAVIGLVMGLGVWTSSNIAYFVLPGAVVALGGRPLRTRARELLVGAPLAAVGLAIGAYPYLRAYVATGGAPLRIAEKFPVTGTYTSRVSYFVLEGLPGALGFRTIFTHEWIAGALGIAAYVAVLGVIAWSLLRSWPGARGAAGDGDGDGDGDGGGDGGGDGDGSGSERRRTQVGWAVVGLLAYPFVYAAVPFVMDDGNLRYTFFVVPFVALVLARVVDTRRGAVVALSLTLVVTLAGLGRLYQISETADLGYRVGTVDDLAPVIEALDRAGIDAVYGDYWVTYRLTFETDERVIGATTWGIARYAPYNDHVRSSARAAWVVDDGRQRDALLAALDRLGVRAEVIEAGDFTVVIPERNVDTMEVPEDARRPT